MQKRGQAAIQTLGLLLLTVMAGGFAIDTGLYFTVHQGMQNSADAAALAAASELFKDPGPDAATRQAEAILAAQNISEENMGNALAGTDVEFGFVDTAGAGYDTATFTTPSPDPDFSSTGGYNAVRVTVKAGDNQANGPISALFTKYLGFDGFSSQAQGVAIFGGSVTSASGLRPVYMCQAGWDEAVSRYGDPTIPEITFYGDSTDLSQSETSWNQLALGSADLIVMSGGSGGNGNGNGNGNDDDDDGNGNGGDNGNGGGSTTIKVGDFVIDTTETCGFMGAGNWGFADLSNQNGAPGADQVGDWFENGYDGEVTVGENYQSMPGNQIHAYADELQGLIDSGAVITIPLYSSTSGNGSNATYEVSAIAAFKITAASTTGQNRYIRGKFERMICSSNCTADSLTQGGSITKIRLVH